MQFKTLQSLCLALLIASPFMVQAKFEIQPFATPEQEDDYKQLIGELRCLVCQNQNLADSNAELAQDMRKQVAKQLRKGSKPDEIVAYMVNRYGDFVMYRPPFKATTMLLWLGPLVFFIVAAGVIASFMRKQKTEDIDLSEQQTDKAHSLLDDD
jgi:cytochrome c-type biogenesis protein CcmH